MPSDCMPDYVATGMSLCNLLGACLTTLFIATKAFCYVLKVCINLWNGETLITAMHVINPQWMPTSLRFHVLCDVCHSSISLV
jgi:hypothetical protein